MATKKGSKSEVKDSVEDIFDDVVVEEATEPVESGDVILVTRWGHAFQPAGDLPTITPSGTSVPAGSVQSIMEQSRALGIEIRVK